MKYIDAEKLKYEIERLEMAWKAIADNAANSNMRNFYDGGVEICKELLGKVDSLQQEQPELDLENAIQNYTETLYHQTFGNGQNTFDEFDWEDIAQVIEDSARHFYELGLNAK